jgi:hypothetical protein
MGLHGCMALALGRASFVAASIAVGAIGCEQERVPRVQPAAATLTGRVRLADGAQLPEYAPLDLARQPLHAPPARRLPPGCAATLEAARRPVVLSSDGRLGGVVVAASDFTRFRERRARVHRVVIRDCRLQPAIVAAMGGDTLALENAAAFPFEPLLGPTFSARSLPSGRRVLLPLAGGKVESIQCTRSAPCGRTDVIVFHHPVYAVTDARGEFRIDGFPPSELVRVSAWHPLFEESQTFVWVEPGQPASIELALEPRPRFRAAPASDAGR